MRRWLIRLLAVAVGLGGGLFFVGSGNHRVDDKAFDVVAVDLRTHSLELRWKDPGGRPFRDIPHLLEQLAREGHTPTLLTNAGIFEPDFTPTGLLVERGVEIRPLNTSSGDGNFFLEPNGVFFIDRDGAHIVATRELVGWPAPVLEATQSGPLLVRAGAIHPAFRPSSKNVRLRSGIGVRSPNEVVIAISREAVTFEAFAELFRANLGCPDALFLDGEISALWAPSLGREELGKGPYAAMIAVTRR